MIDDKNTFFPLNITLKTNTHHICNIIELKQQQKYFCTFFGWNSKSHLCHLMHALEWPLFFKFMEKQNLFYNNDAKHVVDKKSVKLLTHRKLFKITWESGRIGNKFIYIGKLV